MKFSKPWSGEKHVGGRHIPERKGVRAIDSENTTFRKSYSGSERHVSLPSENNREVVSCAHSE